MSLLDAVRSAGPMPTSEAQRAQKKRYAELLSAALAHEVAAGLRAVGFKGITAAPDYGKNLNNRFADLCTEAITLHMRFPYAVVCALFAFPAGSDRDTTPRRSVSTFRRATKLLATVTGRRSHGDSPDKFENVTMLLFQPLGESGPDVRLRLVDASAGEEIGERVYFELLRDIYNGRNPHAVIEAGAGDADC